MKQPENRNPLVQWVFLKGILRNLLLPMAIRLMGSHPIPILKNEVLIFILMGDNSYDNRYLLDVNYRADGSSVFGSNKQFTTTWAVGLAWNLHNEKFIKDNTSIFSVLKLRASIGNPGNQNFQDLTIQLQHINLITGY